MAITTISISTISSSEVSRLSISLPLSIVATAVSTIAISTISSSEVSRLSFSLPLSIIATSVSTIAISTISSSEVSRLSLSLLCWGLLNRCRGRFLSFGFFLDSNEEANDILRFDHVVFINLKFTEDVINLSFGHLVSPGHESMLEHLGVNLSLLVIGLESLDNKIIRVVSISSHLFLEHLDHVVVGACTSDLTKETIKFSLSHEDTNIVKGTTKVVFVDGTILVDVHKLEAVLVHL